ncbi:hypothetical protein IFR05_014698, partial [Cadophora sp. M221]
MSKSLLPSRTLLSNISRTASGSGTRIGSYIAVQQQCRNLSASTTAGSTSARRANGSGTRCLQAVRRDGLGLGGNWSGGVNGSVGGVRGYKTVQEAKSRYKSGPFSSLAGLLFLSSGAGLVFYFRYEKARMERKRVAEAAKGVGRPK